MEDSRGALRLKALGRHLYQQDKADTSKPIRVVVTGAAGAIGYALSFMIA